MNWNEYARDNKQCFVKHSEVTIQATRYEPSRNVSQWLLYLPEPHDTVYCKTFDEARDCAARFGCTVIL